MRQRAGGEAGAPQTGHHDGEHQVRGDGAHADPEPVVRGQERNHQRGPADGDVVVEQRGQDVRDQEDEGQQRHVAVQLLGREARPRGLASARWVAAMPSTVATVSRANETNPVLRVKNHRGEEEKVAVAARVVMLATPEYGSAGRRRPSAVPPG